MDDLGMSHGFGGLAERAIALAGATMIALLAGGVIRRSRPASAASR